MDKTDIGTEPDSNWFVGATFDGNVDQTSRFVREGIWENGYDDKYLDLVRSMRPGDRIAIKSSYTRKHGLEFDNRGNSVSVMAIKAVGTITGNLNDGKRVRVDWKTPDSPREWYFYTNRKAVWRVVPGDWTADGLLAFAFGGSSQEIDRFRQAPFWRERFGPLLDENRFLWTGFYEDVADKLLEHREDRRALIEGIHEIGATTGHLSYLRDKFDDHSVEPLRDICPFTALGTFNRSMTDKNRKAIAGELARLLGVETAVPESFEGIPVLNNQRSWFFAYAEKRGDADIDALWNVFAAARRFVESDETDLRDEFIQAFDAATKVWGVAWNLSTGLYWAHPWEFPTLDSQSRQYLTKRLGIRIPAGSVQGVYDGEGYLTLIDDLKARFEEDSYPVHSFPELSQEAWLQRYPENGETQEGDGDPAVDTDDEEAAAREAVQIAAPIEPYSVDQVLKDGCFLDRGHVERLLERLRTMKNLILQGPPGTGKTWIAKRLAYALMREKDDNRIRAVQFHPNLSYEDFVRGWRPTGEGRLAIADGVFLEAIRDASASPSSAFVVVIEEINRGNPAQIFGELLTLLEAGKRTPNEALELSYPDAEGNRLPVHIPENLYVIGTMNIADRSLALVDLAFRRRFAFVTLEPVLGVRWRDWVVEERGVDPDLVEEIARRIGELNATITESLGNQFRIGHSYVTPTRRLEADSTRAWFIQVAETEIGPLLEEYWFDAPSAARDALERLVDGW